LPSTNIINRASIHVARISIPAIILHISIEFICQLHVHLPLKSNLKYFRLCGGLANHQVHEGCLTFMAIYAFSPYECVANQDEVTRLLFKHSSKHIHPIGRSLRHLIPRPSSRRAATIVLKENNCHLLRVDKEHFNRILRDVEANTLRLQEHGKDVLVLERVAKQRGQHSAFK